MYKLTKTIKDLSIITYRGIKLLIKRKRNIEKIKFDYFKSWRAEQSYLILNIQFKNAIYYRINGFIYFDALSHVYINLKKIKTDKLNFEIVGIFQKQIFTIELNKEIEFNSDQYKTTINQMNFEVNNHNKIILPNNLINYISPTIKSTITKTQINNKPIKLNLNPFKIENYL